MSTNETRGSGAVDFVVRRWSIIWRLSVLALVLIVVFQNLEPTRIDLLFWSLPAVPKLVLILVSAVLGALTYAGTHSGWLLPRKRS